MSEPKLKRKLSDFDMSPSTSSATFSTNTFTSDTIESVKAAARLPASRRRSLGDSGSATNVNQEGLWIRVEVDSAGIPKNMYAVEVDESVQHWRYVGDQEWRSIDRLPLQGIYFFLY